MAKAHDVISIDYPIWRLLLLSVASQTIARRLIGGAEALAGFFRVSAADAQRKYLEIEALSDVRVMALAHDGWI